MINEQRLIETFTALTAIDAESGGEAAMRAHLTDALAHLGIGAETDAAGSSMPFSRASFSRRHSSSPG